MLREYVKGDELLLNANEFASVGDIRECLDYGYKAMTFQKGNDILCIFMYLEYVKHHYAVFSLISRDVSLSNLKEIRRSIHNEVKLRKAKTFLTFCNKSGKLDRWHRFMGFQKERSFLGGKAENMVKWILKWD